MALVASPIGFFPVESGVVNAPALSHERNFSGFASRIGNTEAVLGKRYPVG
jgi:hypothetical protein